MKLLAPLVASLATTVSATGIILPLYLYPGNGASVWTPAINALKAAANAAVPWIVILNPYNGPGLTYQPGDNDANIINGVSQFNALAAEGKLLTTVGYVHLEYGKAPVAEVENNLTTWANWTTYAGANLTVGGIFFDEAIEASGISDGSGYAYLEGLISFARNAFPYDITAVCNFGALPNDTYYNICDVIIVFESCLDFNAGDGCSSVPQYQNQTTIDHYIPTVANRPQAGIIIHNFQGTAADGNVASVASLQSYVKTLNANNVGWGYFTTAGYADGLTAPPANISNLATVMANAIGTVASVAASAAAGTSATTATTATTAAASSLSCGKAKA